LEWITIETIVVGALVLLAISVFEIAISWWRSRRYSYCLLRRQQLAFVAIPPAEFGAAFGCADLVLRWE
jgi:H+/Cl- antiporter ClcA